MATRDLTPEEVSQLIDQGVILNEPGAGLLIRVMAKWFSANPQQAKEFLERRGFEVKETDRKGKLQFAIRHRTLSSLVGENDNPWKVLDPKGFDFGDLADIAFDIFVVGPVIAAGTAGGAIIGAGAGLFGGPAAPATSPAGAVVGAAVGGGIGAAGIEATRQLAGGVLGVNTQADLDRVATAGVLGAVLPGLGQRLASFPQALLKFAKFANRKVGNIGRNLAARVAGSSEEQITTAAANAQRTARIISETETPAIGLLDKMRGRIQTLKLPQNRFPESVEMDSLLEKARPIPVKGLLQILLQRNIQPVGNQRVGVRSARRIAQEIAQKFGFESPELAAGRALPRDPFTGRMLPRQVGHINAQQAQEIKQILQSQIDFSGRPGEKFLNRVLKQAQGNLRNRILASLPSTQARARYKSLNGFSSFTDTNGKFHFGKGVVGKMQALNELNKRVGEHKIAGTAETFLKAVTGSGRTQERRLVEQFDSLFGSNFIEEGTITRLATKPFGRDAPKITATGQFFGTAPGAAGGFLLTGTPEGAAAGALVGFAAATPKSMLRTARGLTVLEQTTRRGIRRAGRGLQRVEPIQDFIGRFSGPTAAALASKEREFSQLQLEPAETLTDTQRSGALSLVEEINAMPGLTGLERMDEFQRRSESLVSPQPSQPELR